MRARNGVCECDVCTTRPCVCCVLQPLILGHVIQGICGTRLFLSVPVVPFFSLSTLPLFSTFVILWRCLALRGKANQNDLQVLKSLHRRHYRVKVADMPTCLSNHGTRQLPALRLPPCPQAVYHKHRHLTCWTAIIKASIALFHSLTSLQK